MKHIKKPLDTFCLTARLRRIDKRECQFPALPREPPLLWLTKHFADFRYVRLFIKDHLARVFL